jgi:transcriptional regulator with PAS, ATPase and Fis domain
MRRVKAYIEKVGASDSNVLITGETGTGKELVAELIQQASPRRLQPFVCINCAAIPDTLLESELFGYEKGTFTGANMGSEGKLTLADGGAIFFDEIGDMSPNAQAKILRAIESREVYRLGGKRRIPFNVRVLAATNHDLEQSVARGQFRKLGKYHIVKGGTPGNGTCWAPHNPLSQRRRPCDNWCDSVM